MIANSTGILLSNETQQDLVCQKVMLVGGGDGGSWALLVRGFCHFRFHLNFSYSWESNGEGKMSGIYYKLTSEWMVEWMDKGLY